MASSMSLLTGFANCGGLLGVFFAGGAFTVSSPSGFEIGFTSTMSMSSPSYLPLPTKSSTTWPIQESDSQP